MSSSGAHARAGITVSYLLTGMLNALWGATLPVTDQRLDLGAGRLGGLLIALAAGALAAMPVAGWLAERWTGQRLLRLAAPAAALALTGPALAPSFTLLVIAVVVLGMAFGALNVALSVQAVAVERQAARPIMATLHGTWTLGAVAGGTVVTLGLRAGIDGQLLMAAGSLTLALAGYTAARLTSAPLSPRTAAPTPGTPTAVVAAVPGAAGVATRVVPGEAVAGPPVAVGGVGPGLVVLLGLIGAAAFLTEGAATDWAGIHATRVLGADPAGASLVYTIFFVAMTVVRFGGDALRARLGAAMTIRLAGCTAVAGYSLVLLTSVLSGQIPGRLEIAIAGWALAGAGVAVVWPIVTSALGAANAGGRKLSAVTMISYGGGLVGPAVIGLVATTLTLPVALLIPAAMALLVATGAPAVFRAITAPQVAATTNYSGGSDDHYFQHSRSGRTPALRGTRAGSARGPHRGTDGREVVRGVS
jgi:MFS family permease